MTSSDPFRILGLNRKNATEGAVKQAYARKLKQTRPDEKPGEFIELRQAFETARQMLRRQGKLSADAGRSSKENIRVVTPVAEADIGASMDEAAPDGDERAPMEFSAQTDEAVDGDERAPAEFFPHTDEAVDRDERAPTEFSAQTGEAVDRDERAPTEFSAQTDEAVDGDDSAPTDSSPQTDETADGDDSAPTEFSAQTVFTNVAAAMARVEELSRDLSRSRRIERWIEILDDPCLVSIDEFQEFERQLRSYICRESGFDELERPQRRMWMNEPLMFLLNQRFGWSRNSGRDFLERDQFLWLRHLFEHYPLIMADFGNQYQEYQFKRTVFQNGKTVRPKHNINYGMMFFFFLISIIIGLLRIGDYNTNSRHYSQDKNIQDIIEKIRDADAARQ